MADNNSKVVFTDNSKETIKILKGLSRSALRESGKVVRKIMRDNIPKRSGRIKNHIASWAFISKKTGQPQLQIGYYKRGQVRKRNKKPHHNPWWVEFGTNAHIIKAKNARAMVWEEFYGATVHHPGTKGTHVLRNSVYENIDAIRAAQASFLGELNKTIAQAQGRIVESEEVEDDL
ncbi:MAG: hypothetical protein LBC82_01285 [Oscillospiraceae bacterium]|jgi:hypothetical protein|nr:hypothetical protein [Oscillospiraceae bacterium]